MLFSVRGQRLTSIRKTRSAVQGSKVNFPVEHRHTHTVAGRDLRGDGGSGLGLVLTHTVDGLGLGLTHSAGYRGQFPKSIRFRFIRFSMD